MVELDDALDYVQPTKYLVESTDYSDEFDIPVLTAGKSFLLGYSNEEKGIYNEYPVIIFDDFTTSFHYVDFAFKVKSSALKILKPKNSKVDIKYIYYAMSRINFEPELHKRYWISKYSKFHIPLPPLPVQERIAEILDAADELRQKDQALLKKYDDLTQSLFLDMFGDPVTNPKGWETKILGNICGVGSSRRVFVDELVDNGIPFYRGTEIGKLSEGKSITPSLFITNTHFEKLKEQSGIPQVGDLLMPSICPDGRIWRVPNNDPFYFKDGRVLWIKINRDNISSVYLRYLLKAIFFANYKNIASGTTFAELKIFALKKIKILFPPLDYQNKFEASIEKIELQKEQVKINIKKSEDLFQSLLQKAFKGELVSEENLIPN